MKSFKNFVNGRYSDAADGRTTPLIDPVTGKQYATAVLSGQSDIDGAMRAAATAFESWKNTTPSQRSLALFRIADAMEARITDLIETEIENTGKPRAITYAEEVPPMIDQIRFFAGAARMLEGKSAGEYLPNFTSYVRRGHRRVRPSHAVGLSMMMAAWKFVSVAAGTVVLKPSDTTPHPPRCWRKSRKCRGCSMSSVVTVIPPQHGRSTRRAWSITGSVRAGMEVAAAAARSNACTSIGRQAR